MLLAVPALCLGCSTAGSASGGAKAACINAPAAIGKHALANKGAITVSVGELVYVELVEPARYSSRPFAWLMPASSNAHVLKRVPVCVTHRAPSTLPLRINAFRALRSGTARITAPLSPAWRALKRAQRPGLRAYESTVHVRA